jgi:hypothetical protein
MPLKIKLGDAAKPLPPQATIKLQVKKTLDGNLLIADHHKMDIIIVPSENKIVTMPKPDGGDNAYDYQRELMDALFRGGIIKYNSVQGGPTFGMLEGVLGESTEVDSVQVALFEIEKYLVLTATDNLKAEEYDKNIEDKFTDPDSSETTELGEIGPEEDEPYATSQPNGSYSFSGYGYLY